MKKATLILLALSALILGCEQDKSRCENSKSVYEVWTAEDGTTLDWSSGSGDIEPFTGQITLSNGVVCAIDTSANTRRQCSGFYGAIATSCSDPTYDGEVSLSGSYDIDGNNVLTLCELDQNSEFTDCQTFR